MKIIELMVVTLTHILYIITPFSFKNPTQLSFFFLASITTYVQILINIKPYVIIKIK